VDGNFFSMMLQSLAALALVLALFAGLVWALRRLQSGQLNPLKSMHAMHREEHAMRVVQRMSIDSRNSIVEIEHGPRRYLLGVSQAGIAVIDDVDAPAPPADGSQGEESRSDEVSDAL